MMESTKLVFTYFVWTCFIEKFLPMLWWITSSPFVALLLMK